MYRPLPAPVLANLSRIPEDSLDVFLLGNGSVRGVIIHASRLVHQARSNHGLSPLETVVLGKGLLAAGLHCGGMKGKDRSAWKLSSNGPANGMSIEVNVLGEIRGYLAQHFTETDLDPEISTSGSPHNGREYTDVLNTMADRMISSGALHVTRFPEGTRQPSNSTVEYQEGSIDRMFEAFYLQSEQVPTRIWTSFEWDNTFFLRNASALLLQTLPESISHSRDDFLPIASYADSLDLKHTLAEMSSSGLPASEIARSLFSDFSVEIVGSKGIEFFCSCTKERFATFLQGLPAEDRYEIREYGPFPLKTDCHYCSSSYSFTKEELDQLL